VIGNAPAGGSRSPGSADVGVLSEIVVPDRSLGRANDAGDEASAVRERIRFIDDAAQELEQMQQERQLREREQAIEHQEWLTDITKAGQEARMSAMQEGFTGIMQLTRVFAGEQSGVYQTLFAVQKAAAVAESIVALPTSQRWHLWRLLLPVWSQPSCQRLSKARPMTG